MRFRNHREVDGSPIPDVFGGVEISLFAMTALLTNKLGLAFTIRFVAIPARATSARSVARVYHNQRNASQSSLVVNKDAKLRERPVSMFGSLSALNGCPLSNAGQFLNGNRSLCALRFRDKILANAVIGVSLKAALSAAQFLEPSVCGARANLLQGGSAACVPPARGFDLLTREGLPVAVGCQIDNTKVNAKYVVNLLWSRLRHFAHGKQKEVAFTIDQIRFALLRGEPMGLLLTAEIGNFPATAKRPNRDELLIGSPGQNPVVISNRAKRLESALSVLIELVGVSYFGDAANDNLSRQVKLTPDLLIDLQVQGVLLKRLRRPGKLTNSIASLIRQFKSLTQQFSLFFRRIQFDLRDDLHAPEYITPAQFSSIERHTGPPPRTKVRGLRP